MEESYEKEEEEYVLLDLDGIDEIIDIPPNISYELSGLDTTNPILTLGGKWKLIGEYQETIGTCYVFTENGETPILYKETGPSEANLFSGACIIDPNQTPAKQVKPMASLQKILKFRSFVNDHSDTPVAQTNPVGNNESHPGNLHDSRETPADPIDAESRQQAQELHNPPAPVVNSESQT